MISPVIIGNATLHLGDCREILPTLPKVDAVITDPPYADRTHKMAKTNKGKGHGTSLVTFAALTDDDFAECVQQWLVAASGWVVATCDYRHARLAFDLPEFVRLGAWVKPNPMPQISADRPGQGFETVLILHAGEVKKAWNRGGGSGVWTFNVIDSAEVSTQKPIGLLRAFVSDFTNYGHTVADPFIGSGTTGVAAGEQGRKFVGVEQDPERFDIACRRIDDAQRQGRLIA
jgi:site-specific DNA-methyltransferase (adenine-specific)